MDLDHLSIKMNKELLKDLKNELAMVEEKLARYHKLILKKSLYEQISNNDSCMLKDEYKKLISEISIDIEELKKEYPNLNLKREMHEEEIKVLNGIIIEKEEIENKFKKSHNIKNPNGILN